MKIEPYLFLDGRCDEAIDFYRKALGAQVQMLMRNRDSPEPSPPGTLPPGSEDKVMHASLLIGESMLMLSDGHCSGQPDFAGFSMAIGAADVAQAEKLFNALADGGKVQMPLGKTFWSPAFGTLTDRFGVGWMVNVDA